MPNTSKPPPPLLIDGISRIRSGLGFLRRSTVPANVAMLEIAQGAWLTQALYAASKLGIFDALGTGPATADDIASRVGAQPRATYRLMRALASNSILKLRRDGRFALTRLGQAMRSDTPGTMAPMVEFVGHPKHWEDWSELLYSVRTGDPSPDKLRGMPFFDYLETDPDLAKTFNDAMTGLSRMAIESITPAYDFTDRRLIVDVGGGHGALLAAILEQSPDARGVLFDLPTVVENAGTLLDTAGVSARSTVAGGSFFESVPDGGDAYVLKTIIHDWDDENSLTILRNIRTAIAPEGKVLLMEMVLPESAAFHPGMLLDLEMLVTAGGHERTASGYAKLLSEAGFRQLRVIPTAGPLSIVEAVPA